MATVLTTENGDFPFTDTGLVDYQSNEIKVHRTKTHSYKPFFQRLLGQGEPLPSGSLKTSSSDSFVKKSLFWARTQLVAPDMRILWNNHAYKKAENILVSGIYDAVITTGPPHSTHLIGLRLKEKYPIKWIADFRDPWTDITYNVNQKRNKIIDYIDKDLEKKVLSKADVVVTVSKIFAENLEARKKVIVPNAFDEEAFRGVFYEKADFFRIKYIGTLPEGRIKPMTKVVEWISEYKDKYEIKDFQISFIGAFPKEPEWLEGKIQNIPFVTYEKSLDECVNAEILLLIINQEDKNEGIITHKLYEYIASKTFILAIGPKNTEVEEILNDTKAGILVSYDEKELFLSVFVDKYNLWKASTSSKNTKKNLSYSVSKTAQQYKEILEGLADATE